MLIDHTILGLLHCQSLTGYDLKKIIQGSVFLPWSGNNNQIYKALLSLEKQGYVINEVIHQDGAPSKKKYTITESGQDELKRVTMQEPESFDIKKPFLVQLARAEILSDDELKALINRYEESIKTQLLMAQNQTDKSFFAQGRNIRESTIWNTIQKNIVSSYQCELNWIGELKEALF